MPHLCAGGIVGIGKKGADAGSAIIVCGFDRVCARRTADYFIPASVMLPLFLPEGASVNQLLTRIGGGYAFSGRGIGGSCARGLQALPPGQEEGGKALGLSYWRGIIDSVAARNAAHCQYRKLARRA